MQTKETEKKLIRMVNSADSDKPIKSEYQTVRLFAILGILTFIFVLMIRLVQNGPNATPQRMPTTSADGTEPTK